ncbi:MAG: DEAD/DEAH box helicase [Gemmatimonadota bacterium]
MDPRVGETAPEPRLSSEEGEEFQAIVGGCLRGLEEEIEAVRLELTRRGLERPVAAGGGRLSETGGSGFHYEWTLPRTGLQIRHDDGVRIRSERGETLGFVTDYDRRSARVRIAASDWLGRRPGPAELEFDPTWLLGALAARLHAVAEAPERYHPETALRLLGRTYPVLERVACRGAAVAELNEMQREALERLLGSQAHFVWGPPGTGKTLLLGHAVGELAGSGRVLVAATTNGALDEAAARAAACLGEAAIRAGQLIRVGAEFSRTGDRRLSLAAAVERRLTAGAGGIARGLRGLEERLTKEYAPQLGAQEILRPGGAAAKEPDGDLHECRARLARLAAIARVAGDEEGAREAARLAAELHRQTVRALREARVVLSTLAGLAAREELTSLRFRSLVLDEASGAPLPYVLLAACLASRSAVAIGDFQQLPAVVLSRGEEAARWLSRDLFREAGIVGEAPPGEIPLPDPRDRLCAMLVEQYRMASPIRALVSDLFYGGRLRDAPAVQSRPAPAHALILLETGGLDPAVERAEGSRANPAHVRAVLEFLVEAGAAGIDDVAVVVPYRLQARHLWRQVRGELGRAAPRQLEISTVHRFQGREKAVIVFDTVDAPPGRSWFLHEGRNRDLPRLLNVALSRTKEILVLVGTSEGLRSTLPEDALLNRVIARIQREGTVVDARRLRGARSALFGVR